MTRKPTLHARSIQLGFRLQMGRPRLPKSCNKATSIKIRKASCAGLETAADQEDDGADHDGQPASKPIARGSGKGSANESTAGEDGNDSSTISA